MNLDMGESYKPCPMSVTHLVERYGSDRSNGCGEGKIESMETEIRNTRAILARLIDKIADKRIFTDEELVEIIRGY